MPCKDCIPFYEEHAKQVRTIQNVTQDKWLLLILLSWALAPVATERAAERLAA